jgi:hypothetical protein
MQWAAHVKLSNGVVTFMQHPITCDAQLSQVVVAAAVAHHQQFPCITGMMRAQAA